MHVHATHTVHAVPDMRITAGRFAGRCVIKNELRKRLADEFYAFLPKCLRIIWIQRVSSDPFATDVERHVVRNNVADVAVLAISATDLVSGRSNCSPHRSCSPLWNGLQLITLFTCGSTLLVCLVQHLLKETLVHVRPNSVRMHRCSTHATVAVPFVECNVALALKRQGITDVRPLAGGLEGWLERGYPVVSSAR